MAFIKNFLYAAFLSIILVAAVVPGKEFHPSKVNLVKVNSDNLWVDKNEISVLDYREFIYSVTKGNYIPQIAKEKLAPDTSGIQAQLCNKNIKRDDLPITGITREQAEEYCRFRSWAIKKSFDKGLPKSGFRLLSEDEVLKIHGEPSTENCIHSTSGKTAKISGILDNADEWLSNGKAIVNGKVSTDGQVQIQRIGFRCCLEY